MKNGGIRLRMDDLEEEEMNEGVETSVVPVCMCVRVCPV